MRLVLIILITSTTILMVDGRDRVRRSQGSTVFADLSLDEMNEVIDYLHQQTKLNLVRFDKATMKDASIFLVEAIRPNKAEALSYIDDAGPLPERAARVIIMRGDLPVPIIEEYSVSPIPNPSRVDPIKNPKWKDPFPFNARTSNYEPEQEPVAEALTRILTPINDILLEMTGGWGYVNCSNKCLTDLHGVVQSIKAGERKSFVYLSRDIEGTDLHPIGLQFIFNYADLDPKNWGVDYIWLQGQVFQTFAEVRQAYNQGTLNLFTVPEPDNFNNEGLRSSMNFRGDPRPSEAKRGPRAYMPDGDRLSVSDRHIKWLGWEFEFALLASSGIQLFDVRFLKERIAYEIAFQECGVFYSGGSPAAQHTNYFDSFTILGQRVSQLFIDIDCPDYAEFFDFVIFENGAAKTYKNGACVFEHNRGIPLRRHYSGAHDAGEPRWAQGIADNVLIFRQVLTVENYDYIIDFMFHQAGQIEGKVSLSGYPLSTVYTGPEMDKYGHVINERRTFGMLHHHFNHLRVDLDILGTSNRFETLDIKIEDLPDEVNPGERLLNRYFDHTLKTTELDAAYKFNFSTPKYLLVCNDKEKNEFGYSRCYRIQSDSMSKYLLPRSYRGFRSRAWIDYQMVVTQYKDSERQSSSSYHQMEQFDPVFSFQDYIDDNDNIVDQDLVLWITLGTQHIPHAEDVPVVNTIGVQLTFYLLPYNYFNDDPSLASRDNIRVSLNKDGNKFHYSGVPAGNAPPATTPKEPCVNVIVGSNGAAGRLVFGYLVECMLSWLVFYLTI